jgi:hypothetical protein
MGVCPSGIVMFFIPIWLLVLAIYYSKGHTVMPQLQRKSQFPRLALDTPRPAISIAVPRPMLKTDF